MERFPLIEDDGGRGRYFKGTAGDCVCRAITLVTDMDYMEVYNILGEYMRYRGEAKSARNGILAWGSRFNDLMLENFQLEYVSLANKDIRFHPRSFKPPYAKVIAQVPRHFAAVMNGRVHDTHLFHKPKKVGKTDDLFKEGGRALAPYEWCEGSHIYAETLKVDGYWKFVSA